MHGVVVVFGVVLFAAQGLWVPAWASPPAAHGPAPAQITAAHDVVVIHARAGVRPAPATTGPAPRQPATTGSTQPPRDASLDGSSDRADMVMMLLVAVAMVTTVVFKGSQS